MASMQQDWQNKYLTLFIVILAFIDGMLVVNQFQTKTALPAEGLVLEDIFEQKNSSIIEPVIELSSVPFVSQAPQSIWQDPWASFAEEASAYMASLWASQAEEPSRETAAADLLAARDWETANLGTYKDTDLTQTLRLLVEFYKLEAEISLAVTRENMLAQLDAGKIILVPVLNLENPHYGEPGPVHHMLVIYAYEGEEFLTNDPGTIRGEGYRYPIEKILERVQDLNGEVQMIVVSR